MEFDFSGWATKNNIKCSDGRTILKDAFAHNDGKRVPLVWNHNHSEPTNILGYALLENRPEGVYAYGKFNDSNWGQHAKTLVQHGDIVSLSIYANKLKQNSHKDVLHGEIRELSLVLAGANDGAKIENVMMHSFDDDDSFEFYIDEDECELLEHAEKEEGDEKMDNEETVQDVFDTLTDKQKDVVYAMIGQALEDGANESMQHADAEDEVDDDEETVQDVFDTLTDKQKNVVYALIGQALQDKETEEDAAKHSDYDEGEEVMKTNVFDQETVSTKNTLSHADQQAILALAKEGNVGSFQRAMEYYAEENELAHDAIASGFATSDVSKLFPEYKDVRPGAPELVTNDQGWISVVMRKVHKSPISRIRTGQVDIRNIDTLRAKGYKKGKEKGLTGNFNLVRRTTDPQTVYVKNALHRDDIIDITDFDYVSYLYNIDRMMLNEELAMAIMLGDGREDGDEAKIMPDKIRPIWLDDDLYTLHVDLDIAGAKAELQGTNTGANFGENYITAEAMINTVLYAREKFKGTGTPDFFCTPHMLNVMLLARDLNGRRIYSSKSELAAALNVGEIVTAEQFEGKERTDNKQKKHKLVGIICNLADYSLGATKGGQISHFTDFDLDFNQQKSLLETRCSGALTRVYSAIAIEELVGE